MTTIEVKQLAASMAERHYQAGEKSKRLFTWTWQPDW
jgi:hypothetical protein